MGLEIGSGANGQAALKIRYAKFLKDVVDEQIRKVKNAQFWQMLTKTKGNLVPSAFGSSFVVPVRSQIQAAVSADYTKSYNKATGSSTGSGSEYNGFVIPVTTKYNHASVSGLANLDSASREQAFVKLGAKELDSAIEGTIRQLTTLAAGSGYGDLGRIGAVHHTVDYVDLTNKFQAANFRKGMDLIAAATQAGGVRSATALTVTQVDPSLGRLILSGDPTALGWVSTGSGDFLFVDGDKSTTPVNWLGLKFWIPTALPAVGSGADASGIERSSVELAGHRYDGGGGAIVDVLQDAAAFAMQHSLSPDMIVMNPLDIAKVSKAQETKRHVELKGKTVDVGFEAPTVQSALGELPIVGDRTIVQGEFYFVDSTTFSALYSGPDLVHVVGVEDGGDSLVYRKVQDADKWLAATRSASNMACDFPGANMVVTNYV